MNTGFFKLASVGKMAVRHFPFRQVAVKGIVVSVAVAALTALANVSDEITDAN